MNTSESQPVSARKKLHRRYTPIVFSLYMAAIMALLMCSTIVAVNHGLSAGYVAQVFKAYVVAMPVAFFCVLIVRPVVIRLVAMTVDVPGH